MILQVSAESMDQNHGKFGTPLRIGTAHYICMVTVAETYIKKNAKCCVVSLTMCTTTEPSIINMLTFIAATDLPVGAPMHLRMFYFVPE